MTGWYVSHAAFTGTVIRCGPFVEKEEAEKWATQVLGDQHHGDWDVQEVVRTVERREGRLWVNTVNVGN